MVIVGQDDSPSRTHGPDHPGDNLVRPGDVFEQEPGMGQIELAPFLWPERQCQCIPSTPGNQIRFRCGSGLATRFGELFRIAFDRDHPPARTDRPRHGPRKLAEPAADIQHLFPSFECQLAKTRFIEKSIQLRKTALFSTTGSVQVLVNGSREK